MCRDSRGGLSEAFFWVFVLLLGVFFVALGCFGAFTAG